MFIKKTSEVVKEELEIDDTLQMRTKWEMDDITKLLFIYKVLENLSPSH